ncbi:MAG: tetratricopeptide repeat protein [Thiobacillaceae bacterium]
MKKSVLATLLMALGLISVSATACGLSRSDRMFTDAIKTNPHNASAYDALGRIQYMKGCVAEARENLLTAVLLDPKTARAWMNLGLADFKLDRMQEAAAAFKMSKHLKLASAK